MAKSYFGYKSLAELKSELNIDWTEEGMIDAYEPSDIVMAFDRAVMKHDGDLKKIAATMKLPMSWVKTLVKFDLETKAVAEVERKKLEEKAPKFPNKATKIIDDEFGWRVLDKVRDKFNAKKPFTSKLIEKTIRELVKEDFEFITNVIGMNIKDLGKKIDCGILVGGFFSTAVGSIVDDVDWEFLSKLYYNTFKDNR